MTGVTWDPAHGRPSDADEIEEEIRGVAPGAQVKLTRAGDAWRVRALGPASMCGRGGDASSRDLSHAVAEVLSDRGYATLT